MTRQRAILELIFAGALWGFGFVATTWALKSFSAAEVLVFRFTIAVVAGELISFLFMRKTAAWRWCAPDDGDFRRSVPAGLLLGSLLILQTIGLQYTTATNSGFITTLYVIIVPLVGHLTLRQKIDFKLLFFVVMALLGTILLVGVDPKNINKGDLWTLACAFAAAFHIIYIGSVSKKIREPFRFNTLQSLWSTVLLLPLLALQSEVRFVPERASAWYGILVLALGSSLLGFFIQVRAQKVLTNTTASMLFLLESPFAWLFGTLLLHESLTTTQLMGAMLIMSASYLTIRAEQT